MAAVRVLITNNNNRYSSTLPRTSALDGGGGEPHAPAASITGKDPVSIVQKAGWAPGPVCTGAENLTPMGFDPRTVQPVASRYTDYAIRPTPPLLTSSNCRWGCTSWKTHHVAVTNIRPTSKHLNNLLCHVSKMITIIIIIFILNTIRNSQEKSVRILLWLWTERPMNRGSIPQYKQISLFFQASRSTVGPQRLLLHAYRRMFPQG
jgi:hypothetical protein